MATRSLALITLSTLLVARTAAAETWSGDFETGDLKQWDKAEMVSGDPIRLKLVQASELGEYGVRQGKYALRVTVRQGDDPISASGNRAELVHGAGKPYVEGDEIYLAWSTLFPTDFGTTSTWQVFTQFHHTGCCGSPPLEFDIAKDKLELVSQKEGVFDATVHWSTPLVRGKWHDFIWHIKWSKDPTLGLVELWYDGEHVLPPTRVRTLFSDGKAYLKQGYYRNDTIAWQGVLYHDGTRIGPTYESVAPPPPVADAGPVVDAATPIDAAAPIDSATVDAPDGDLTPAATDDAAGCGCTTTGARTSSPSLAALGLVWIALRRRARGHTPANHS